MERAHRLRPDANAQAVEGRRHGGLVPVRATRHIRMRHASELVGHAQGRLGRVSSAVRPTAIMFDLLLTWFAQPVTETGMQGDHFMPDEVIPAGARM